MKAANPSWPAAKVEARAREELEAGGLAFLKHTITVAQAARPKAGVDEGVLSFSRTVLGYMGNPCY